MSVSDRRFVLVIPAIIAALSTVVTLYSQANPPAPNDDGRATPAKEWTLVGGDWTNQRHSSLPQINLETVNRLGGAWMSERFDEGASSRSTPVVKGGLMFVSAGSRVYALDVRTGKTVWRFQTESSSSTLARMGVGGGGSGVIRLQSAALGVPNYQGVATGEGKVFVGLMDGNVIALDQRTGALLWRHQVGDDPPLKKEGRWVGPAPTYAGGAIYLGLAADYGTRGKVVALDANTGSELWSFYTVPAPGEPGNETWPQNTDKWKWGGGGIWQTGVIDPELGLIYFSAGNPVPQYGGEPRPGDNLFTGSVLALDIKTGKLRWHYQVIHHDIWDADGSAPTPLILYDAQVAGRTRKAIASMRADGYLFLLNRETGEPVIPVEERPVPQDALQKTSPTQPFPIGADSILPECSYWRDKIPAGFELGCTYAPPKIDALNILAPGFSVRVVPMSYSPQTRYFYAQGSAGLGWRGRSDDPYYWPAGGSFPGPKGFGIIAAIDSRTDKIAWRKEFSRAEFGRGGFLSTVGGLLFRLAGDGRFVAHDAKTGNDVWQFQTGFAGGGGPPSAFEVDGEEYIAVSAGPVVWAFKLGGTVPPAAAPMLPPVDDDPFSGPITETNQIETATLHSDINTTGRRYFVNQYLFNPYRARIAPGVRVVWVNNGKMAHTITAVDGSWTTGTVNAGAMGFATFAKSGKYAYTCKEHPWSYGQIIVEDDEPASATGATANGAGGRPNAQPSEALAAQAERGGAEYGQHCGSCHGSDLSGSDRAPALAGAGFSQRWAGLSAGDLFERVRSTMPSSSPGSLSNAAYLDVVAFLLKSSDLVSGAAALPAEVEALKGVRLGTR